MRCGWCYERVEVDQVDFVDDVDMDVVDKVQLRVVMVLPCPLGPRSPQHQNKDTNILVPMT
jgi:hypothetical protein